MVHGRYLSEAGKRLQLPARSNVGYAGSAQTLFAVMAADVKVLTS